MTIQLHLGVADIPYADEEGTTTGDVAEILEEHYEVIGTFYAHHERDIIALLEDGMRGAIENRLMGAPVPSNPLAGAESKIEEMFRKFLSDREIEQPAHGVAPYTVPTMAAILGLSSRFKGKKNPAGRRPSFIDTGLFQSSFRAWVD